jgi:hypothetical protein
MLEGGGCIGKSERHDKPFKQAIASMEGNFPFIIFSDAYKVISMSEVNFGVELGFPGSVQKVGNQWEWITIFLGDLVKALVVDTQVYTAILLANKKDWSSVRRVGRTDKADVDMFFNEGTQGFKFGSGERVHLTWRRWSTILNVNFEINRGSMRRKSVSPPFAEDVRELSGIKDRSIGVSELTVTDFPKSPVSPMYN